MIYSGKFNTIHCQGIAVDEEKKYIYFSFTTLLVKTDFNGKLIGSVGNIMGHLGCIDFNKEDGCVYASLEFKKDMIGQSISKSLNVETNYEESFYIARFDCDKIDKINMDASKDKIMSATYLDTVVKYYNGKVFNNGKMRDHVFGASGIDGLAIGPGFNDKGTFLHVCLGIYSDIDRDDNDNQVILQYDIEDLKKHSDFLTIDNMHKIGTKELNEYHVYTGNTSFGVQNLEYDKYTNSYFLFVYHGYKSKFPNYNCFAIDCNENITDGNIKLKEIGETVNGISGINCDSGAYGVYSFGDGRFLFTDISSGVNEDGSKYSEAYVYEYKLVIENKKYKFERNE